ncbi:hypothetical protein ACFWHL_39850 [Streptomyces massasporeus]
MPSMTAPSAPAGRRFPGARSRTSATDASPRPAAVDRTPSTPPPA